VSVRARPPGRFFCCEKTTGSGQAGGDRPGTDEGEEAFMRKGPKGATSVFIAVAVAVVLSVVALGGCMSKAVVDSSTTTVAAVAESSSTILTGSTAASQPDTTTLSSVPVPGSPAATVPVNSTTSTTAKPQGSTSTTKSVTTSTVKVTTTTSTTIKYEIPPLPDGAVLQVVTSDGKATAFSLDQLAALPLASVTIEGKVEEGPRLLDILRAAGVSGFTQVILRGSRGDNTTNTVTSAQVDSDFVLDFTNRGTVKVATPSIPKDNWAKDIYLIEVR
jgi:hypothetical protein